MYITRTVEHAIQRTAESFPCIAVYGARQVGKSTTVNHIFGKKYQIATLDDVNDRALASENPRLFLETYGTPLIIDEIQKVPSLLDEIKKVIDQKRMEWVENDRPHELLYVLTGSNRYELQQGISDSLAGRCGELEMSSFSNPEKNGFEASLFDPSISALLARSRQQDIAYRTRAQVFEGIFQGGMPDIVLGNSERDIYFQSYINTYLEKDIRQIIQSSSEVAFRNFLSIIALRTSQELHYDVVAQAVGIDVRTCKKWISILETSGIICLLQPYMANMSNRIIKSPKLYFLDTGLCSYLCRWPDSTMLENGAMGGAFFETYIVSEFFKNLSAFGVDPKDHLYYYRDKDQKEIDLLFVQSDTIYPIEIKKSTSPKDPLKNFSVLDKYHLNIGNGLVIDSCDKIRPITENAFYYPVYRIGE